MAGYVRCKESADGATLDPELFPAMARAYWTSDEGIPASPRIAGIIACVEKQPGPSIEAVFHARFWFVRTFYSDDDGAGSTPQSAQEVNFQVRAMGKARRYPAMSIRT